MRNLLLTIGLAGVFSMLFSCTKKDCDCTFYDAKGNVVESYTGMMEEMRVSDCSVLDTYADSTGGFVCK
ncbi:MAG: hypothetical protein MJZ14_00510 [Paludibacteraceae bacterium]|nr:hypothetical protein [Paludibacteraceae bacterium]